VRGLIVFELKLKLSELDQDLLALRAEDHMPQLRQYELQMLDQFAARVKLIGLFRECLSLLREGLPMRLEFRFKPSQFFNLGRDQR